VSIKKIPHKQILEKIEQCKAEKTRLQGDFDKLQEKYEVMVNKDNLSNEESKIKQLEKEKQALIQKGKEIDLLKENAFNHERDVKKVFQDN